MPENIVETSTVNESTKLPLEDLPMQENTSVSILSSGNTFLANEEKPVAFLVKI